MNRRLIGLASGGALLASVLGACEAQQQDPQCIVARAVFDGSTGSFATTYSLKEGQDPALACATLQSEQVGLQKYFSGDPGTKNTVGIRTKRVGALLENKSFVVDPDAPNQPNSVGTLETDAPGPDNFCEVPALNPTRLVVRPATGTGTGLDLTYAWSNLRVYNTPDIPGTQFIADLRYTENGCTAEYTVRGIWPVVTCSKPDPADSKKTLPDESKCLPYADPPTRLRGSGINPNFPVKCDTVARICVLTGEVPSVP